MGLTVKFTFLLALLAPYQPALRRARGSTGAPPRSSLPALLIICPSVDGKGRTSPPQLSHTQFFASFLFKE